MAARISKAVERFFKNFLDNSGERSLSEAKKLAYAIRIKGDVLERKLGNIAMEALHEN